MFSKYIKKPVVSEAIQFKSENLRKIMRSIPNSDLEKTINGYILRIITLDGKIDVAEGDFIIKDEFGEFNVCEADLFKQTYEEVK